MLPRAKRGRPEDLRGILAQVPEAPPLPGDEVRAAACGLDGDS
jgi:hypothetical protein